MTIKKSYFLLNFLMFCLGATVGRQIGDSYIMRHIAAKSADSMLMNLPHCFATASFQKQIYKKYLKPKNCVSVSPGAKLVGTFYEI
jgi:hypothetical protein